jgi:hypothetical protein
MFVAIAALPSADQTSVPPAVSCGTPPVAPLSPAATPQNAAPSAPRPFGLSGASGQVHPGARLSKRILLRSAICRIETAPVVKGTLKAGADSISFMSRSVDRPPPRDTTRLLRFQRFGTGDKPEEMRTIGERLSTLRGQNLALWVGQGGQHNATAIESSVVNSFASSCHTGFAQ